MSGCCKAIALSALAADPNSIATISLCPYTAASHPRLRFLERGGGEDSRLRTSSPIGSLPFAATGDVGFDNKDPFVTSKEEAKDPKTWIESGPHLMMFPKVRPRLPSFPL